MSILILLAGISLNLQTCVSSFLHATRKLFNSYLNCKDNSLCMTDVIKVYAAKIASNKVKKER